MNKENYKKIIENYAHDYRDIKMNQNELQKMLNDCTNEILSQIIQLSDDIESEDGTPDIKEWKAFKHFRNTLRDIKIINQDE